MLQGDKVKFTLQFRGREMQFQNEGSKMFEVSDLPCAQQYIITLQAAGCLRCMRTEHYDSTPMHSSTQRPSTSFAWHLLCDHLHIAG